MKNKIITAKLGVGPMSPEIIESVFRYSHYNRKQLMLIASKNQIDYNGGYVNNWKTAEYMKYVAQMRQIYDLSDVLVCRDHCGPGFNGNFDLDDVNNTIKDDIDNGFDLIHIDFCHYKGGKEMQLEESKKAVQLCLSLNPGIGIEIGTDENFGANYSLSNVTDICREIDYFKDFCEPDFFVVQTGTVVKEIGQAGFFNEVFIKQISDVIKGSGLKLKEHNADYLHHDEIKLRHGLIGAMNIAPQLGVVQTMATLTKCLIYGIKTDDFLAEVYNKHKWQKWMKDNSPENKMLCCQIAGHYHFGSDNYKRIFDQLQEREDFRETIINLSQEVIANYIS